MVPMKKISYHRHRFHPDIIKQAIWLYFRFTMSYRDVEELLAERGIDVSYETVRRWALKFAIDTGCFKTSSKITTKPRYLANKNRCR